MQGGDDDHDHSDDLMDFDNRGHQDQDLQAPHCTKRLFSSQGTPERPVLFTEDQQGNKPFSQDTLLRTIIPEIQKGTIPTEKKPKKGGRKRKLKGARAPASNSQPAPVAKEPIRAKDKVGVSNWHWMHELAKSILPPRILKLLTPDMRSLHDMVHHIEDTLIKSSRPLYPVFPVKVPKDIGLADEYPADVFFVRFEELFDMYHMKRLPLCFVRLLALKMEYTLMREETRVLAVMDPYHLQEGRINHSEGKRQATRYVQKFFQKNHERQIILMPYFPE